LGAANGTVSNVGWDGTNLTFSYSGYTYSSGVKVPAGTQTKFQGTIVLPGLAAVIKNWTATK
jgi:hypothetical protein